MLSSSELSEVEFHSTLMSSSEVEGEGEGESASDVHHRRIVRAQRSFELLKSATLLHATGRGDHGSYTPARLAELQRFIAEEMDGECEALACVHLNALIYAAPAPAVAPRDGDPMAAFLAAKGALLRDFFHYGTCDVPQLRARALTLFGDFVALNRVVRHDWSGRSGFVSPIAEDAMLELDLPNPEYVPLPTDLLALLHAPKRRKTQEAPTVRATVELGAANDDFRVVGLHLFFELRLLADYAEAMDAAVTQHFDCGFDASKNNVGWMAGLFRNANASRIIIPMQERIHEAFLYPGDIRHAQTSLAYDLSLTSASVVGSTIASETYTSVAAQLTGNMPLLWSDMRALPLDEESEKKLAWDVRAGVLLFHFYLLHIIYAQRPAEADVLPVSIYTIRRAALSNPTRLRFSPDDFRGKLLLFRRHAYLVRADGVHCYAGYHALEHGLLAWASYVHGERAQITRILSFVDDAPILPAAQHGLSSATTSVPNSAYATSVPRGSIFSSAGT